MNWRSFGTLGSGDGGCPPDLGDVVSRNLLEKDIIEKICLDGNYRVPPEIEVWRDWRGIARVFDKHPSILENRSHISVSTYNEKGEFVLSLDDRPYEPELHDDIIEQKARLTKRLNLDDNIIKCEENPAH